MPFTFFAHQGPLVPLARRYPDRVDWLTFMVGTMAPDFAYLFNHTRFEFWAHDFPGLATFCVPASFLVAWTVARVLGPVVPDHLPRLGRFELHDFRGLAAHRFGWVRTPIAALVGAATHVGLDHFTHSWGILARHWRWYRTPLIDERYLGKAWPPFEVMQYLGHVVLSAMCLWFLARYGRERWLRRDADRVAPVKPTPTSRLTLWAPAVLGVAVARWFVVTHRADEAADFIRVVGGGFAGLLTGAVLARRLLGPPSGPVDTIRSVDDRLAR